MIDWIRERGKHLPNLSPEQGQKKDRGGLSSELQATDRISHSKYVFGVHERLLCATVEL